MIVTLLTTTILIVLGVMRVKRLSVKMTAQIIYLYETLYQISNESKHKGASELSYKESSKELNELHLTFNRVARTMQLATQSMAVQVSEEKQAQALLSYADAYHIYHEFDEFHQQKGVCLTNIGSIMMQQGDYQKARKYYDDAIKNLDMHKYEDYGPDIKMDDGDDDKLGTASNKTSLY